MRTKKVGEFGKGSVFPTAPLAVDHHQPRTVPRLDRVLGDQIIRQVEVELRGKHARYTSATCPKPRESTLGAIERNELRIISGRSDPEPEMRRLFPSDSR